jgi:uncharacterized cupredoxin-like copper-binding protein
VFSTQFLEGSHEMLKKLCMFALIGIISVTVLAACGSGDDSDEAEPTVTRVPAENAPADATFFTPTPAGAATEPASPAAEASPAASPVSGVASPGAASPVAGTEPEAAPPAAGATALSVTTGDLFFDPKTLAGTANADVVITITNNGALAHDFSLPDLGITSKLLNPGESTTVTVNAAAGDYTFICTVPGHADAGMTGTLTLS